MEIVNSELTVTWSSGAQVGYVDQVVAELSDGGYVDPVGRQTRPLMQATFATVEVAAVRAMYGTTRSGRKGFFIRPPLEAFYKVTGATLGTVTGSEQTFQLAVSLGTLTWDALYPDTSTIIIYDDGTPLTLTTHYTVGALGVITLLAGRTAGHTITTTFEYKTAVRFVDAELSEEVQTVDYETLQSCTIREVF